jgi:hypothetical protein
LNDVPAVLIQQILPEPTLIHLPGAEPEPIFVSILLHGDEDVGLKAIQQVMKSYRGRQLPRALTIFIGNVEAASAGVRYLPHQLDYNRVWPQAEHVSMRGEHRLMQAILQRMLERRVAASVDLHNNSGRNPHYSCVCSLDPVHTRLASLFAHRAMFFTRPKGVQTAAFAPHCPAITCECGPIGDASGVKAAALLIERLLSLGPGRLSDCLPVVPSNMELYRTLATWRVLPQASLSLDSRAVSDVFLRPDLDCLNFQQLPAGTELGQCTRPLAECMELRDEDGLEVSAEYLLRDDAGNVALRTSIVPSMLTTSQAAIRQDCVGYFLVRQSFVS